MMPFIVNTGVYAVFWVEASDKVGIGHVVRMTAIAQQLTKQGKSCLFVGHIPHHLLFLVEGVQHIPLASGTSSPQHVGSELQKRGIDTVWFVIDSPFFAARTCGQGPWQHILLLQDVVSPVPEGVTAVLNPNYGITTKNYVHTTRDLLVGEQYLLLRPAITAVAPRPQQKNSLIEVLVSMGGADPYNLTVAACDALQYIKDIHVTLICGPANLRYDEYVASYGECDNFSIKHSVSNMEILLAKANVAVIAAGGTLWEALYLGCSVASFSINDVQATILSQLEEAGSVCYLGGAATHTQEHLTALLQTVISRHQREGGAKHVIDGQGVHRVTSYMKRRAI